MPYYLSLPPKGPSFYANVYHPAFNVDADEALEAVDRFVNHTRAVGKGVQSLRNIFGKVREARVGRCISPRRWELVAHGHNRDVEGGAALILHAAILDHLEVARFGAYHRT